MGDVDTIHDAFSSMEERKHGLIMEENSRKNLHIGEWRIDVNHGSHQRNNSSCSPCTPSIGAVEKLKNYQESSCKLNPGESVNRNVMERSLTNPEISKQNGVLNKNSSFDSKVSQSGYLYQFKGMRVLLAEDNLVNQKVACQQLQKFGAEVDVVSDGKQCLNALNHDREKYDLILMDVQVWFYT